jgi:hypothetical protein
MVNAKFIMANGRPAVFCSFCIGHFSFVIAHYAYNSTDTTADQERP